MPCGAKTRAGTPCQRHPVAGKKRCRLHGGAPGSGAPPGERNGNYRHGWYSAERIAKRRRELNTPWKPLPPPVWPSNGAEN